MGIPEEKARSLCEYEHGPLFSPLERLVLRYVEEIERELRKHSDDTQRVELALIVGPWNMTNRLFNTLRVEPEPLVEERHVELAKSTFDG